ncbi:hypothetical protein KFL_001070070 [Klebsormidium nitens]|uniref:Uncharacterized protein n=1 Tax=Klebsormidium nitens TaxID=105231 RepID=A0A1Y1HZE3_KLENI|nr:hypothetical protein KFL_001070070 [Klebsormidium nitens]|eukprot:GAQ82301.1 hypothetical protein KFL_001070070 [Klebsormidium nitens]
MAALTSVQKASLLLVLGILALSGCAVICAHSAEVAVPLNGLENPAAREGVGSHQVCICSPKVKGQNGGSPDCQCTDLSILDKLLFPEETASTAAGNQADVSIAGHQSAAGNASKELENNNTEPSARVLRYKSPRAVFFQHFSPLKHTDKSLAETSSVARRNPALDGLSSNNIVDDSCQSEDSSPGHSESTSVATREESHYSQKHPTQLDVGSRARALYRLSVDYLSETPWSVALLSVVMTLSVSWGLNKLLARAGLCKDFNVPDGCPQWAHVCQSLIRMMKEWIQATHPPCRKSPAPTGTRTNPVGNHVKCCCEGLAWGHEPVPGKVLGCVVRTTRVV